MHRRLCEKSEWFTVLVDPGPSKSRGTVPARDWRAATQKGVAQPEGITSRRQSCDACPSCPCWWSTSGYIPFDPEAAKLMFSLVSSRYERASLIVTSTSPSAWGEIFGDEVVAAAMIDRLAHHAEILGLKGDSYRLRDTDLGSPPPRD